MHAAALEELDRELVEWNDRLSDRRLVDLANVVAVLRGISVRTPTALRGGMVESLRRFMRGVLEDRGAGSEGLSLDEVAHLSRTSIPVEVAAIAAGLVEECGRIDTDPLLERDVRTVVAGLACIGLHLSDPDLVDATALLERIADVERAHRRVVVAMEIAGRRRPELERCASGLPDLCERATALVVDAMVSEDDRIVWCAWRRAGEGDGRIERAKGIARDLGLARSRIGMIDAVARSMGASA